MLETAKGRLRAGETIVQWRDVQLTTLKRHARRTDMALQALDENRWLLEIHTLVPAALNPAPLSATLRGVAHEVKNPLTGLRGAAQLLVRRSADDDTRELAEMIMSEADRLVALTDRLLSGGPDVKLGNVNLHGLLERVRQLCAGQVKAIDEDYDPSLPDVFGDADRLQQLLLNLARNAIEAGATRLCFRTRVAHRVILAAGVAKSAIRVDVVDDGPGVPEAVRDRLFDPMVSGHADGTGLGLALALETARDHGGDLRHAYAVEGTVFSLYLPIGAKAEANR